MWALHKWLRWEREIPQPSLGGISAAAPHVQPLCLCSEDFCPAALQSSEAASYSFTPLLSWPHCHVSPIASPRLVVSQVNPTGEVGRCSPAPTPRWTRAAGSSSGRFVLLVVLL